jgi:hypothetical protein
MDCDGFSGEELFHIVSVLSEFIVSMGEEERRCFNDEVVRRGPLATRFNLCCWFWPSKLDLSRSNTSDAFVNAVDVVERREEKTVSMSTVSPLISASHSVLGNPAGALDAHLIHRL